MHEIPIQELRQKTRPQKIPAALGFGTREYELIIVK